MTPRAIRPTVFATPAPAGPKKGFPIRAKAGKIVGVSVTDDSKRSKPWQAAVQSAAAEHVNGGGLLRGPLAVAFTFYVRRPKGHFSSGKNNASQLLQSADPFPAKKPDVLKLARAVEDALTGIVWNDDAQIADEKLSKRYGEPDRCEIEIIPLHRGDE